MSNLFACSESKKGNPQLVKDAQELAELGCKCADVRCLHNVRVRDQSYAKIRLGPGVKDLKENERAQFNTSIRKWSDCEYALTMKKNEKK